MNKYDEKMDLLKGYYVPDGEPKVLSERELSEIEDEIGDNLPDDYREFLSKYGGFAPDGYAIFSFKEPFPKGQGSVLDVFYGLLDGDDYDVIYNYEAYKNRIGVKFLPIAQDPYGNQVCLVLTSSERGKILFWYHAEELLDKSNLYLIADSFDEFMNSLELKA